MTPRDYAIAAENAELLPGSDERFNGYGVMGLPFASGHILGLRRFPASSVGPGYSSVWHRDPAGAWTFYADVPPMQACTRYFGADVEEANITEIAIDWPAPYRLHVSIPGLLEWDARMQPSLRSRAMNAAGSVLPDALWRNDAVLSIMGAIASRTLGAGRLALRGKASNGQWFVANPRTIFPIVESTAMLRGESFGPLGPVAPQARLGDFWIPNRGLLAVGRAYFEPLDERRHRAVASRSPDGG
ncbi:MAG: hypothetical protein LT102_16705 [Burkholderiaceae bacterium]|nr:hypothetical protein [Burkholderiaceae bacterium]